MGSHQKTQFNKIKKERYKHLKGGRMGFFYYSKRIHDFKGLLANKNEGELP